LGKIVFAGLSDMVSSKILFSVSGDGSFKSIGFISAVFKVGFVLGLIGIVVVDEVVIDFLKKGNNSSNRVVLLV